MGLSFWHLVILVVIVLLLFGPSRLPNLGKSLGEAIRGFKKGLDGEEIDVTNASRQQQIRDRESESTTQTQQQTKEKDKV